MIWFHKFMTLVIHFCAICLYMFAFMGICFGVKVESDTIFVFFALVAIIIYEKIEKVERILKECPKKT